ncbi:MAG TPA: hypothetical protein VI815_00310 [Candidatus Nanoarchaeia archaeon]|nr:hypothetical protein [Candidatus Nanoarchaeia archaeon]
MKQRLEKIKKAIFSWPYMLLFVIFFFVYLGINIYFNELYITLPVLFFSYKVNFIIPFLLFFILIPLLFALNVNLTVMKIKDLNTIFGVSGGFGILGVLGGLIGGACPGCIAGIFPTVLSLLGLTGASLNLLPFYGLELQSLSVIFLIIGVFLLSKEITCKIPNAKNSVKQKNLLQ